MFRQQDSVHWNRREVGGEVDTVIVATLTILTRSTFIGREKGNVYGNTGGPEFRRSEIVRSNPPMAPDL